MHMRGEPQMNMQDAPVTTSIVIEVEPLLPQRVEGPRTSAAFPRERLCLDPGFGFRQDPSAQTSNSFRPDGICLQPQGLRCWWRVSRKSMIGQFAGFGRWTSVWRRLALATLAVARARVSSGPMMWRYRDAVRMPRRFLSAEPRINLHRAGSC